jgi:hypothetical protein
VHVSSLRVELTRARNGALWASLGCAGDPPAKCLRATPVSGARAAVPRTHASRTVRPLADGPDQIRRKPLGQVHRGPMHWVHARDPQPHQPSDQGSIAQLSRFSLRAPGFS